jgi:cephalosporin hydroxylase
MTHPTAEIGTYFVDRRQPELTNADREIIDAFHKLYYTRWLAGADTINLSWFGYQLLKCPLDLWIYQEILVRTAPELVIETGTFRGGSALYIASILDLLGQGEIISIDVEARQDRPRHPRITYLLGSSVDSAIVEEVRVRADGRSTMIILDSDHHADHVYRELVTYSSMVRPGGYLIVEDTNVNGHPAFPNFGPGPMEAADRFLKEDGGFDIDLLANRFLMTLNPRGYLRRVRS